MPKMPTWKPPKNIPKALEDGDGFWEDAEKALLSALIVGCSSTPVDETGGAPVESRSGAGTGVAQVVAGGVDASLVKLRKPESTVGSGSPEEGRRVEIRVQ